MGFFDSLQISSSGMQAQRLRMDVVSNNIANADSTRTPEGGAYRRQEVVFTPVEASQPVFQLLHQGIPPFSSYYTTATEGVQVSQVVEDKSPTKMVYQPTSPDANAQGYVEYPNVNPVSEMVDMVSATRSYEANVTALDAAKQMALHALEIGHA